MEEGSVRLVRFLRSERENDFSETGGPPSATEPAFFDSTASGGGRQRRECGFLPPKETDGAESHGNGTRRKRAGRKNAIYSPATITRRPPQLLSSLPHRRRENAAGPIVTAPRQTHPPKNTPQH